MKSSTKIYFNQLKASLKKNILLKRRDKRKTLMEMLIPLYSFLILALISLSIPNPNFPAIREIKSTSGKIFDNFPQNENHTIAIAPNSVEIMEFTSRMSKLWRAQNSTGRLKFIHFSNVSSLLEHYWFDPMSIHVAIVFHSQNPITRLLKYEIRTNPSYGSSPSTAEYYSPPSSCRKSSQKFNKVLSEKSNFIHSAENLDCPVNRYYTSSFIAIQTLIEFTKLSFASKKLKLPDIDLQLFPKDAYTADWLLALRIVIPLYMELSLSQFVTYLLMLIVGEKENKIKEAMKMMGLRDSVFWISWFVLYAGLVTMLSGVATAVLYFLKVFQNSNMLLIFLLMILYGFSIILFCFMITPFFSKARTAGIVGNFFVNITALLYFLQVFLSGSSTRILWAMSFISSTGFALALDKALVMELMGNGVQWNNIWSDQQLPFGYSLIILLFDGLLYALLAYYLDGVIPSEYGTRKPLDFCIAPFYKFFRREKEQYNNPIESINESYDDVEPVPMSIRNNVAIEIADLHKSYKTSCYKPPTTAIDGINLKIYEGQITAILGHNGAGKTTMFNILTGMTESTSGTIYIFKHDVRDVNELNVIRRMTGVCPQHDILFDLLTPTEHLNFYGAIRGIPESKLQYEVTKTLAEVELEEKKDVFSKYLSGGQKRKLSIGIAVIGDPKIIILDEPTAGVDPYSRRQIWSLLQKIKEGKVILLTTHFMDEADILADRKAVISNGKLRCCGSSMFLKNKFGIGYHLTMVLEKNALESKIYELVLKHVATAEKARHHANELSFILPHNSVDKFAPLFAEIEEEIKNKRNEYGISSYGVSMTTLEEVFLHLEKEDVDSDENTSLIQKSENGNDDDGGKHTITTVAKAYHKDKETIAKRKSKIEFEEVKVFPNSTQILKAMIRFRILRIFRDPHRLFLLIILPIFLGACGIYSSGKSIVEPKMKPLILGNDVYPNSRIALHDMVGINGLLDCSDVVVDNYDGAFSRLLDIQPHLGAINVTNCCDNRYKFQIAYNDTTLHSLPIVLNILNNALYRKLLKKDCSLEKMVVISNPFPQTSQPEQLDFSSISSAFSLGMIFVVIPIILSSDVVYDREIKAKNQLRVSGLSMNMYFTTYIGVLSFVLLFILSLVLIMIQVFRVQSFTDAAAFVTLSILLFLYTPASILYATCLSYMFTKADSAQSIMSNIAILLGIIPFVIVVSCDILHFGSYVVLILHGIFSFTDVLYLPFAIIYFVGRVNLMCSANNACHYVTAADYLNLHILFILFSFILHIPLLYTIVKILDIWKAGGQIYPRNTNKSGGKDEIESNDSLIGDKDAQEENRKANNAVLLLSKAKNHPVVVIQNLRKEYNPKEKLENCIPWTSEKGKLKSRKNSKVAVSNLSLTVEPGEVLGLLGHNGAGKTTTMRIIIADESSTKGKVFVGGHLVTPSSAKNVFQMLGYCPQHGALWKNITIKEHIELYAAVRGVPPEHIPSIVGSYMRGLRIEEHANKKVELCSGGTQRKLSFAISMLGNPCVVLLDEPSTGMDPKSKRFLWDTIIANFQGNRGALLTTHSMEEADALCSRVGIMVQGQLRCIGSTQHLKDLYGAGYTLEVKLKSEDDQSTKNVSNLRQFISNIFPQSILEETFLDHLVFSVPKDALTSLSDCFSKLEAAKNMLNIEDYSFSQTTLEQVFLKIDSPDSN